MPVWEIMAIMAVVTAVALAIDPELLMRVSVLTGSGSFVAILILKAATKGAAATGWGGSAVLVWLMSWVMLFIGAASLPESTSPPAPPRVASQQEVRRAIESELGSSNRDRRRLPIFAARDTVTVTWSINDNLTTGMTSYGAREDVYEILKVLAESGLQYERVILRGTFSLVDQFGNSREGTVVQAHYTRDIIDQINWDGFRSDNVYNIAESAQINPELR